MKILLFTSVSALFLLLSFVPHANGDLKSQKQALLNFAAAFPHNRRKINWFSSNSVCSSWVGITCNSNRTNVLALRLPGIGLSGPIPANTLGKLDTLETLSLRSNRLDGEIPPDILSLKSLQNLYLQSNNLSGGIPSSFSPQLNVLDLSLNSLTGSIPPTLQNLQNLTSLSLQNNSLTGAIPALNTTTLKHLNLGFNHLNGSIPSSLQKYPASSFEGNSELCGTPLNHCPELSPAPAPAPVPAPSRGFFPLAPSPAPSLYSPIPSPNSSPVARQEPTGGGSRKGLSKGSIVAIAASSSAAILLLVAIAALCCFKKTAGQGSAAGPKAKGARSEPPKEDFGSGVQEAEKNKLVFFEGSAAYGFDLEDLLRASAEVLGKGSCGTTYKALLEEGNTVVVKRLKELIVGKKEFELQIEAVGRVGQHPNVAPLRAYYYSKDERLLVYDYAPIGSLSALLHGNKEIGQPPLDWESRLKVSLGVAKGIHHIHSSSGGKFVHGNIKSSNVLLTQHHLDARVSDFGLASLMSHPSRAAGYRAPEVVETRKLTQKSDVYSFGVVLLEMLTGKSPVKLPPGQVEALDLPRWVQSVVREEWTAEVFDVQLMQYQNVEEEMVQLLQVAMACVAKTPDARPDMAEVVKMIEGIRPTPHINVNE